jgi:hypothetical protein
VNNARWSLHRSKQPSPIRLCGFVWSDGLLNKNGAATQRSENDFVALSHKSFNKHPSFSNYNAATRAPAQARAWAINAQVTYAVHTGLFWFRSAAQGGIRFVARLGGGFMTMTGKPRNASAQRDDAAAVDRETLVKDNQAEVGARRMEHERAEYHSVSPELTAGDLDADWQEAEDIGDETPGGHVATPDQDNVDEIARAVGMELQDNQELHTHEEIFAKRDQHRWELNRSSADGDTL